jgi:SulP family sulfate permease
MGDVPADFLGKWAAYARHADGVNPWALTLAALTFALILLWPRVSRRIPGAFVALVLTAVLVRLFHIPVETIGDRFGPIEAALPAPALPAITLPMLRELAWSSWRRASRTSRRRCSAGCPRRAPSPARRPT